MAMVRHAVQMELSFIIQREVQSVQPLPEANPITVRLRSLEPLPNHVEHYTAGKRHRPSLNKLNDNHLLLPNSTENSSAS